MAGITGARVVSGKALSTNVTQRCHAINALVTKLEHAERKVDEYQRAIGQHIAAVKTARPDDWQKVVKTECKLGRSRAYELLAIADGTKTAAEVRKAKAVSEPSSVGAEPSTCTPGLFRKWGAKTLVDYEIMDKVFSELPPAEKLPLSKARRG